MQPKVFRAAAAVVVVSLGLIELSGPHDCSQGLCLPLHIESGVAAPSISATATATLSLLVTPLSS